VSRARFLAALAAASTLAACAISFDGYELDDADGAGAAGASSSGAASGSVGGDGGGITSSGPANGGGGSSGSVGGGPSSGGGPAGGASVGGAGQGGSGGNPPSCPTDGGPMVQVPSPGGSYCIDKTEVTQDAYYDFLGIADPSDQVGACVGNDFDPTCDFTPIGTPTVPVTCVDWCDAVAFCKVAGKRLCGKIGGGSVAPGDAANEAESQWYNACSEGGAKVFPYGNFYQGDSCHGLDTGASDPEPVGSYPTCNGGYAGILDMSGNVREWEDSCSAGSCLQRGGGLLEIESSGNKHNLRCDSDGAEPLTQTSDKVGFRCCAEL
jgi:formylglycine-generating enzyme required for sulfatase activity